MGAFRCLLALSVLFVHFAPFGTFQLFDGWIAVQSFFIVSGFYIAFIITGKYQKAPDFKWLFWSNRFLRLYPLYWLALVSCVSLTVVVSYYPEHFHQSAWPNPVTLVRQHTPGRLLSTILLITQPTLVGMDWLQWFGWTGDGGIALMTGWSAQTRPYVVEYLFINPAWTISLEIYFYLLAPFLIPRKLVVVAVMCAAFLARVLLYRHGMFMEPFDYRFFPLEIHHFLAGVCAFYVYDWWRTAYPRAEIPPYLFAGVVATVAVYAAVYSSLAWVRPGGFVIKQWAFLAAVPLIVPILFHATRRNTLDRYIGELSYPIYILHILGAWITSWVFGVEWPTFGKVAILVTLALAVIGAWFQRYIDAVRERRIVDATRAPKDKAPSNHAQPRSFVNVDGPISVISKNEPRLIAGAPPGAAEYKN